MDGKQTITRMIAGPVIKAEALGYQLAKQMIAGGARRNSEASEEQILPANQEADAKQHSSRALAGAANRGHTRAGTGEGAGVAAFGIGRDCSFVACDFICGACGFLAAGRGDRVAFDI